MQPRSSACSLIAIIQFVPHSQTSRAIKTVVCCSPGLPFKGWSLEPSGATQMSGEGALFPGRGTLAISWQIPKGGGQRLLWVRRKGGGGGRTRDPDCAKDTYTHTGTPSHRPACTSTYTHSPPPGTQSCRHVGEICVEHAHTCMHTRQLHAHATNNCTHSWAHVGICTKFAFSGYIY